MALPAFSGQEWVIESEKVPVVRLGGFVLDPTGVPLPDVTVELYGNPEVLFSTKRIAAFQRPSIASTVSSRDGMFRISKVPPGRYELRFTKPGFNTLSVVTTLSPADKKASKAPMRVRMSLAT